MAPVHVLKNMWKIGKEGKDRIWKEKGEKFEIVKIPYTLIWFDLIWRGKKFVWIKKKNMGVRAMFIG